jgi:hypothetical protein
MTFISGYSHSIRKIYASCVLTRHWNAKKAVAVAAVEIRGQAGTFVAEHKRISLLEFYIVQRPLALGGHEEKAAGRS